MREKMKKQKGIKLWLMLFVCILCVAGFSGNTCYSNAAENTATVGETQFDIQATFGFNNIARVGKSMIANVTVTNNGEDFNGLVQILIPITDGHNVMYESNISVAAGETKNISMPMYVNAYTGKLVVNLTDEKENVVAKKRVKVHLITPSSDKAAKLVAVLTDNKDVLGYWENDNTTVFYLSEKDMPEQEEGLQPLDFIIIDDFDTQNLNKKQYEALKDWVNKGGNLVIGTGANVSRTLGIFEDNFLNGSFGKASKDGIVDFTVDDASLFTDEKNGISMQQVEKNLGAVFVFSTDLGVDYANWKKEGAALQTMVYNHMVSGEDTSDYSSYYYQNSGLDITDKGKLPSLRKYAVVLFIYVVVVSWILYFVLRKKDKLEWTWGLVPALALIFALIIYGMGAATRITAPFITYARIIEWTGEGEQTGKGATRMAITSPYNEKYSVAVPKGVTAYASMIRDDYYFEDDTNFNDYKISFRQNGDQQIITLNNLGAFETGSIQTNDTVSMKGSYEAEVTCDNYEFKGTFTNKTGREIRNAVFMSDGRIYQLGTIKDGETVKISDKCKNLITFSKDEFRMMDYGDSELAKIFGLESNGYHNGGTLEEKRYANAVGYYIDIEQSAIQSYMQGKVIGILDSDGADGEMAQSWGMDCSGITLGTFPVDVNYNNKDGQTFVADLLSYSNSDRASERYLCDEEIKVEYQLESNETLTGLYYLPVANEEDTGKGSKGKLYTDVSIFEGDIEAYNYETKSYEKIFDNGTTSETKDLKRFMGKENKLVLKIRTKDDLDDYMVPVISATKEVK